MSDDLLAFADHALSHRMVAAPSPMHQELAALVMSSRYASRDIAVQAFRGSGKSTWLAVAYPLHRALFRRGSYTLIVSESAEVAQDRLASIKRELESNVQLASVFGEVRAEGASWGETEIHLGNGSIVKAIGSGAQVRGRGERRPDLIVCDDIEDDEHVESERQRAKLDRWFWESLKPALHRDGRIVLIGTPLHPDALIERIVRGEDGKGMAGWIVRRYPASSERLAGGTAAWPEWWSLDKLKATLKGLRESKRGSLSYSQEYDLEAVPAESCVFQRQWWGKVKRLLPADPEVRGIWKVLALDPAIGEQERNDYSAYAVLGVHRTGADAGKAVVLDMVRGHWSTDEMLAKGYSLYKRWDCRYWAYEGVGFQRMIRPAVLRMCRSGGWGPVRLVEMPADRDKVSRAQGVQYLVEQGLVSWPHEPGADAGKLGARLWPDAWDEVCAFPEVEHDDQTDALVYALKAWEIYWRKERGGGKAREGEPIGKRGDLQDQADRMSHRVAAKSLTRGRAKRRVTRDVSGLF